MLAAMAPAQDQQHDDHARPVDADAGVGSLGIGEKRCCWRDAGIANTKKAAMRRDIGVQHMRAARRRPATSWWWWCRR